MQNNLLSKRILGYDDLVAVAPGSSPEALVDVRKYDPAIVARYDKPDMLPYTGETILVRDTLARKLTTINGALQDGMHLKAVYGFRHPAIQNSYFSRRKEELRKKGPQLSEQKLDERTHAFVAIPEVAGHPTGGAIDITIVDKNGNELDMGTRIADYSEPEKIRTFTDGLTDIQKHNRALLHDVMVAQGFAPFYGEWWHFSYGDREWAAFYNKKTALYGTALT